MYVGRHESATPVRQQETIDLTGGVDDEDRVIDLTGED